MRPSARSTQPLMAAAICLAALSIRAAEPKVDVVRGQGIFEQRCMICHGVNSLPNGPAVGPPMVGIVGRRAASQEDFTQYSPALKSSGLKWDVKTLDEFLKMPAAKVPGTTMPVMIGDATERADVIGYLATLN